jgi:hypothetical protein
VERLHLAAGSRRWLGCESKILEAGAALDEPKLAIVEAVAVAEYRPNLVEGEPQRRMPLACLAAVIQADDDDAGYGANDDCRTQDGEEKRGNASGCGG